jgi:pimeloyl-ACP methyl ester carboxylesterase
MNEVVKNTHADKDAVDKSVVGKSAVGKRAKKHGIHGWRKVLLIIGIILVVIIAAIAIFLAIYTYNNMHFDDHMMDATYAAGYQEKQVDWNGETINYAEGPDNGEAVLLIHGQGVEWEDYASVLPDLAKDHHVFAIDCFGHGKSAHDPALYTCKTSGDAAAWFIQNVIGGPVILSGHSSGGIIAAWVAANYPKDVRSLVLEDPPLFEVTPTEMQADGGCFAWKDSFVVGHDFLNQSAETDYSLYYLENSYLVSMFGGLKPTIVDMAKQYRADNPTGPIKLAWFPHDWFRGLYWINDYDLRFGEAFYNGSFFTGVDQAAMLKKITCPTIYLKATTNYANDGTLLAANTDEDAAEVMSCLPNAQMRQVDSGHDIHYEQPSVFVSAIDDAS